MDIEISADKAKALLDNLTLDHIIDAVGETPTKPDRDALRRDLLICYGHYCIASGPGRSGFIGRQRTRLNSIQKHAKRLAELLKADDADLRIIRRLWPISAENPAHLLPQINFLVEMIDNMSGMQAPSGDIAGEPSHISARQAVHCNGWPTPYCRRFTQSTLAGKLE
jgi:hypothetical protein